MIAVPFNNLGGTVGVESGTLTLTGGGASSGGSYNIGAASKLSVASGSANNATFNVTSGGLADLTGGAAGPHYSGVLTGTGAGVVQVNSGRLLARNCTFSFPTNLFQWTGGTIDVTASTLTNVGFMTVNTTSNSILDGTFPGGILVNQGTFVQVNTGNFGLGRLTHFTNTTTGLYDLQSDGGLSDNSGGNSGFALDNAGLFRKSGGTNVSSIGVPFNSFGGTIQVDSGQLNLAAGGSISSSTFKINTGAVLDITGGSTPTYAGTVTGSGSGTVLLANGTVDARGNCNFNFPAGLFQWTGGTIDVTANTLTNLGIINASTTSSNLLTANIFANLGGGLLVNVGQFVQTNVGDLSLGWNTRFTNTSAGVYDLQSDAGISDGSGGSGGNAVDNVGLFRKSGGINTSSIGVPFNSYGGTIEVDGGTFALTAGNYVQNGGVLTVRLGGRGVGQFGRLAVTGTATLSGSLKATLESGFAPSPGDQFQILSCSSLNGTFSALNVPQGISVLYTNNSVFLVVTSAVPAQIINPAISSGTFVFSFETVSGQSYTIQRNDDLATTNWVFYTNLNGNGSLMQVLSPVTNSAHSFFRARQP